MNWQVCFPIYNGGDAQESWCYISLSIIIEYDNTYHQQHRPATLHVVINQMWCILKSKKHLNMEHDENILGWLIVMMFDNDLCFTGVNLSLLSRVMSSRLSRGTYNGGLLSTEAGTLARVIADGTITLAGYVGVSRLLNITLIPSFLICAVSIIATCYTYNSLYWFDLSTSSSSMR